MIVLKGPPLTYYAARRLADYVHTIDKLAVVFFDRGRVTIKEIQKVDEVEKLLIDLVNSQYRLGGRKWGTFHVHLVRHSEPPINPRRDPVDLR